MCNSEEPDALHLVRTSCARVAKQASHVRIDDEAVRLAAARLQGSAPSVEWDFEQIHFRDGGPLTAQYLLVVDALNFCFWPDEELQYESLAAGLRRSLEEDRTALDAHRLASCDGPQLRALIGWPRPLPLEEERARLLREVGTNLLRSFGGQAANLVAKAGRSAAELVALVTAHFPGFRDHAVYRGQQVAIYKRAQIFVGDIWGAYRGQGLGHFEDMQKITMFADYLVPAVLHSWGVLTYSQSLAAKVDGRIAIEPGSELEVELRACTIEATERLRCALNLSIGSPTANSALDSDLHGPLQSGLPQHRGESTSNPAPPSPQTLALDSKSTWNLSPTLIAVNSVQVDWWLWKTGISDSSLGEHHRTLTIYY